MVVLLRFFSVSQHAIGVARARAIRLWAKARYWNPLYPWLFRWWLRSNLSPGATKPLGNGLSEMPVVYINLERRSDRAQQIEQEFSRLGLSPPERFNAIEDPNPMLGAAKSHLQVLENLRSSSPESMVMVCEDDLIFQGSRTELDCAIEEFAEDTRLDVLCLAYMIKNTVKTPKLIEVKATEHLLISNQILTQACYVLKPSAITPLIESLRQSIKLLSAGVQWSYAAGDVYWQTLQQGRLFFAHPKSRLARQSAGHSDIWNHFKDLAV